MHKGIIPFDSTFWLALFAARGEFADEFAARVEQYERRRLGRPLRVHRVRLPPARAPRGGGVEAQRRRAQHGCTPGSAPCPSLAPNGNSVAAGPGGAGVGVGRGRGGAQETGDGATWWCECARRGERGAWKRSPQTQAAINLLSHQQKRTQHLSCASGVDVFQVLAHVVDAVALLPCAGHAPGGPSSLRPDMQSLSHRLRACRGGSNASWPGGGGVHGFANGDYRERQSSVH